MNAISHVLIDENRVSIGLIENVPSSTLCSLAPEDIVEFVH